MTALLHRFSVASFSPYLRAIVMEDKMSFSMYDNPNQL